MERIKIVWIWTVLLAITWLALPGNSFGGNGDAIVGVWNTADNDAKIEMFKCGGGYCGRIVYLEEPNFPADDKQGMAGLPMVDRNNPNPALRRRSLIGLTFLEGFHYQGDNVWDGGRIYNPENGKIYKARISLADGDHILLRGYWGISLLGKTETWVRIASDHNAGA
jgi:uncharacterized protein (DUF2147 family)